MREPVTIVELDVDGCALTWGVGACTAALSAGFPRKCFNTFATCGATTAFAAQVKTLAFAEPLTGLPPDQVYFPALVSVSAFSATVNIAGSDDKMSALGRRATVRVELQDFPYHDRATDPYQAERLTGAAQWGGVGYDPASRGTFFTKLKARWPYHSGRPVRVRQGFLEGGALVDMTTRHFVITKFTPPDDGGRVVIEGMDILALADSDRAVCPKASPGTLTADLTEAGTTLTLKPAGAGASYAASGRAVIGSELVSFTRVGDVVTLTGRGIGKTKAAAHQAGDTFQAAFWVDNLRIDDVLEILLRDYAGIPAAFIPKAEWAAEVGRWMPQVKLTTHICTPTGVAKLVEELAVLGVSIWWDDAGQAIRLRVNRPVDAEAVVPVAAELVGLSVAADELDENRLTEVLFFSVQIDPTKGAGSADNFARCTITTDWEAKDARRYGDARVRRIYCRWLDQGADAVVSALSRRLLARFQAAPVIVKLGLPWSFASVGLADVVDLSSGVFVDATGAGQVKRLQVIGRSDVDPGHRLELTLQAYGYLARYGYATENTRPNYTASTDAQRARGFYACNPVTLKMSNGDEPYRAI